MWLISLNVFLPEASQDSNVDESLGSHHFECMIYVKVAGSLPNL